MLRTLLGGGNGDTEKKSMGPHLLEKVHEETTLNYEKRDHRWECKYCGRSWPEPDGLTFTTNDCGGVEWLDSEKTAVKEARRERMSG